MIFHKTGGIVIGGIKYSETSKIVKVFTEDFGRITLMAKGARRKKSDFRGPVENFNFIEVVFILGKKDLHTLTECYLFEDFHRLKHNLPRLVAAYKLAALVDETQPLEEPHREVFHLLLKTLQQLDKQRNYQPAMTAFQLKLLQLSGFFPQFDVCIACDSAIDRVSEGRAVCYDPQGHGFICGKKRCGGGGSFLEISPGSYEMIRKLCYSQIDRAHTLRFSRAQFIEISALLRRMFEDVLERKPRAEEVLDHLAI